MLKREKAFQPERDVAMWDIEREREREREKEIVSDVWFEREHYHILSRCNIFSIGATIETKTASNNWVACVIKVFCLKPIWPYVMEYSYFM